MTTANNVEASELYSYANTYVNLDPFYTNARKKLKRGIYSHSKAIILFKYAAERAARGYAKEYGMKFTDFNVPTRKLAAEKLVKDFESKHGNEGPIGNPYRVTRKRKKQVESRVSTALNKFMKCKAVRFNKNGSISIKK